jgi:hypothetical protein
MTASLRKTLNTAAPVLVAISLIVVFSGYHARRICGEIMGEIAAPPPCDSMRFVFYPSRHIDGAPDLGFRPGWVLTYAPPTKTYGTAFYVTFLGKMRARGTPTMVAALRKQAETALEEFKRDFAKLDAAVQVGIQFTNALAVLGEPMFTRTNKDGTVSADLSYEPRERGRIPIKWLTNGITLMVSNGIVVQKRYSYTSSQ